MGFEPRCSNPLSDRQPRTELIEMGLESKVESVFGYVILPSFGFQLRIENGPGSRESLRFEGGDGVRIEYCGRI